jgi:phosphodiesterase/alkaline phosphatase D-like protein
MNFKKAFSVILAFIMLVTMAVPSFAMSEDKWAGVWASDDAQAGIIMFVGSDESQRNFSWYTADENVPEVIISADTSFADAVSFKGTAVKASEGDYANKVTVTGLEADITYYYQCVSGSFISEVYSFTTADDSSFSAMYVTDIHISDNSEESPDNLKDTSYKFNEIYEEALSRNSDISLILSAGDQASEGREAEYKALTASPLFKSV